MVKVMKNISRWRVIAVSCVAVCVALATGVGSEDKAIELYLTDALTFPSRPVQLQARLTEHRPDGDHGMPEELVEFALQGRILGKAITDANGWARLEFAPKMRGNLSLRAKWVTPAKAEVVEGRGVLLSWERRRPMLLIDIAVLVEGELKAEALPAELSDLFPDPGLVLGNPSAAAPTELRKLAKFYYNLVYIDQTGKGRIEMIQSWLRKQEFPPGMIRVLSTTPVALHDLLESLKEEGWKNVSGGIGRTADFAEVLVKNRLKAIMLPLPGKDEKFPRRAILLNDWSRVRRHL
jgi:hypothetical protein